MSKTGFMVYTYKVKKISFISTVNGLLGMEECHPKPAKKYTPKWFKDIPVSVPSSDFFSNSISKTVKICPSFSDYFSNGYILPMWTDIRIAAKNNTNYYEMPSDIFSIDEHPHSQFLDHVKTSFYGFEGQAVFKFNCPWRVVTPPGWSVLQLPIFYDFNPKWTVLPGIIDTDIYHQINQQVVYHGNGEIVEIERGQPLALYIPFKRKEKLDLDLRSATAKDIETFDGEILRFKSTFKKIGTYRKLQRKRDKNADSN